MREQARQRADHRGGLNAGQAVEPVEKALNRLAESTDKCTFEDGVLSLFGEVGVPPAQFNYIKQE